MDTHKIQILGRFYTVKGVENKDYVDKLALFIDKNMREIADATGTVDTQKVAILTSLKIADQLFKLQEELGKDDAKLEKNVNALCEQISMVLEITQSRQALP